MSRDAFLTARLQRFLTERRVAPRSLRTKEAQENELRALLRIVLARAPVGDFEEWWDEVERFIGSHAETRAWPTEKEMLAATQAARGPDGPRAPAWTLDPLAVAARRIKEGEAVSDGWLYGRQALDLLDKGHVTEADMRPARVALYHAAKDAWGEEAADARVAEWQRRHETAKAVARGDTRYFSDPGNYVFRPRSLTEAIARPKPGPADDATELAYSDAPRPYTDAERARMARLRPHPETQEPAE